MMKKSLLLCLFIFSTSFNNSFAEESILADKASQSLLLDIEKLADGQLVTVGERGHILLSTDNGDSWEQVVTPTQSNLTAVDFLDDNIGLAVGFEQTILLTLDGGKSWSQQYFEQDSSYQPALFDVKFINKNNAVAIGAYGLYLESNDGGKTWQGRDVMSLADIYDGFSHFYSLESLSEKHLILVGEKYVATETEDGEEINTALIAESRDGGKTWTKLNAPYDGSFFGVTYAGENRLFAYGLRGNMYQSKDLGKSWQSIFLSTAAGLHDMAILPNGRWVVVGNGGLLVSQSSSQAKVQKRKDLKGRAAVVALNEQELIIVGEGGVEKVSLEQQ